MSSDPVVLGVKVAALEKSVQQLVEAFQINHQEIHKAFSLTDAHLWVLRRICQDLANGSVMTVKGISGSVDLAAYYDLFNAYQQQLATTPKTKSNEELDHEVFGGDLSNAVSERNEASGQGQSAGEDSHDRRDEADPVPRVQEDGVPAPGP